MPIQHPTFDSDASGVQRKIRKLETAESLAMLQRPLTDAPLSDIGSSDGHRDSMTGAPALVMRVAIRRTRVVLVAVVAVVVIVALTLVLRDRGIVIERFDRKDVSIQKQEKLLEKYNSYSGTATTALERPLALILELVVPVLVLRVLATEALAAEPHWRVTVAVTVITAAMAYLLGNGLSAVNVQVRELPIQLRITANDLSTPMPTVGATTNATASFSEHQDANPMANTVLRNLVLPQVTESQRGCTDLENYNMKGSDDVVYRIPQQPWMSKLVPTARNASSLKLVLSKSLNANAAVRVDQFPMNASVAADLLVYGNYIGAWGVKGKVDLVGESAQFFNPSDANGTEKYVPSARLAQLLPPKFNTTEQQDRDWFRQHVGPTMYNFSDPSDANPSLKSWNLTLSHVDIEPGVVWVDAVTIEREMASPRFQTVDAATNVTVPYYKFVWENNWNPTATKTIPRSSDTIDERIDVWSMCTFGDGPDGEINLSQVTKGQPHMSYACFNLSTNALLVVGYGRRLIADAVIENATIASSKVVSGGRGVVANVREVFSVTIARLKWKLHDLAALYNAKCEAPGGCMGLDVTLSDLSQRLVISESALPLARLPWVPRPGRIATELSVVSVRRPQECSFASLEGGAIDLPECIGDVLLLHNVRNKTTGTPTTTVSNDDDTCLPTPMTRLSGVVNNHMYIEHSLQPTYTAGVLFLLQAGVARDVLNQTWTSARMLAFQGNAQDVDVYVYIPSLNVMLTLAGCVLLLVVIAAVVVWPREHNDPLQNITTPQTIARVLFNNGAFPAPLLSRTVVSSTAAGDNASEYRIQSLRLGRTDDPTSRV